MSDHWRLGFVERAVLEALDRLGARPNQNVNCDRLVRDIAEMTGITPRYSYDALCTLAAPWLLHIPLIESRSHLGTPDNPPAPPSFTAAWLSAAGRMALASERGEGPNVPLALINGDLHHNGDRPPFSPSRVIDTMLALLDNPLLSDIEIAEGVGSPASPTACAVTCDTAALATGRPTTLEWTADIRREVRGQQSVLVISRLPLGIGPDAVIDVLAARVKAMNRHDSEWEPYHRGDWQLENPGQEEPAELPLADVRIDASGRAADPRNFSIACELLPGTDITECEAMIARTWGVRTERNVQLGAPLTALVRELVDADPLQQRAALNELRNMGLTPA